MTGDRPREVALWRKAIEGRSGRAYWRSVQELLGDRAFAEATRAEFPAGADEPPAGLNRRELFQLLGASITLAGIGGCVEAPDRKILPYAYRPPEVTPGVPLQYATSMVLDGFATGLLVRSNEGRPTKIEGNPQHPASLGATGVYEQASVLELYDPHRTRGVTRAGVPSSWRSFYRNVIEAPAEAPPWFVMYPQSSPLVASLIEEVRKRHPGARFTFHSPLDRREVYAGARAVFGRPLEPQYDFTAADRVLSLGADFTGAMPNSVRWAHDYARRRRLQQPDGDMGRLYVVESMLSPTGSIADHRLAVRPSQVAAVGAAVLRELVAAGRRLPGAPGGVEQALEPLAAGVDPRWAAAVARDLADHAGASVVIAGDQQPAITHVIAHMINAALGNDGATVTYTEPALLEPEGGEPLEALAAALDAGEVGPLIICEANPVYTAPADLELAERIARHPQTAHLTLHDNETTRVCGWSLPAKHYLESWGDARAYDGTLSLVQPLIRPLYAGQSTAQVLAAFAGRPDIDDHALLQESWWDRLADQGPDTTWLWESHLQRGLVPGSDSEAVEAAPSWDGAARQLRGAAAAAGAEADGIEIAFQQSPAIYDGRFANNGWLMELPHPMTKLTWDNAAILGTRTAVELGLEPEKVVEIAVGDRRVRAPVLIVPGHAEGAVTLSLGYGRQGSERLARGVGVDVYPLRTSETRHFATGAELSPTNTTHPLALTQTHWRMEGREVALHNTLAAYREEPHFTAAHKGPVPTWLPRVFDYDQPEQWAMTIDTMICTGCSACVVACQAENNTPIVGKQGVRNSREMHWLRIDRYFTGAADEPEVINQPMMCQHCEKAPCEYVCPVFATTHSPDGLNEMVYNRCIGTRFCSNNCPYKVRRFNWFDYTGERDTVRLQRNPEVTVRERGVMEKCTYCVQRIRRTEIQARNQGRRIEPGEVETACQQVCPTGAIQFGSLMHEDTEMVRWRGQPRVYGVLHEQGTQPRTQYLAKIRNPNPELA